MLMKLIRYDFKAMANNLFPIYIALMVLSLVMSLLIKVNLESGLIFIIFSLLFMAAFFGSMFATVYFAVVRFRNGLLKNEGYLSFALPTDTATHIIAKVCNALIWGVMECLALLASALIAGLVLSSVKEIAGLFSELFRMLGMVPKHMIFDILRLNLVLVLELIAVISLIYSAIAVGHLFDRHRKLVITTYLIVITVCRSYLLSVLLKTFHIGNPLEMVATNPLWYLLLIASIAIYSALTWFILDRRLNLE